MNESTARRDRDGVCSIIRAQLFQDVLYVDLYGVLGDKEILCDIAIPISILNVA
jgi:hypothetical protein